MRPGVRLAVDLGSVRIGVARSDPTGALAVPVETVRRDARGGSDLDRLLELATEYEVLEVLVGLPVNLSGREGAAADSSRAFAGALAARISPVRVRLVDERLTTVTAEQGLLQAGARGPARRSVVDQAAAVIICQTALDAERATGAPAGTLVETERM
ncbi:MAG: Holliday junction resolvase RuvX [Candidatus Nanopelagicales bacterium]